jgi:hypothetical protein
MNKKNTKVSLPNIFPIHKGHELYCPDDKIKLVNIGWTDEHVTVDPSFFGKRKVGTEGFNYQCPKCNRIFYESVTYYD